MTSNPVGLSGVFEQSPEQAAAAVEQMKARAAAASTQLRETMEEQCPEMLEFCDEMRAAFDAKVVYLKLPDGTEIKPRRRPG